MSALVIRPPTDADAEGITALVRKNARYYVEGDHATAWKVDKVDGLAGLEQHCPEIEIDRHQGSTKPLAWSERQCIKQAVRPDGDVSAAVHHSCPCA